MSRRRPRTESLQTRSLNFANCLFRAVVHKQQDCVNPEGGIKMSIEDARKRREAPLDVPSNLGSNATKDISAALTALLADAFALYIKTKNFHWHIAGPHFRGYHLLLDEQAAQIFAMTDDIRKELARSAAQQSARSATSRG
jgi:starvation-inducible DNA-binding protein